MARLNDGYILHSLRELSPKRFEQLAFALLKAEGHADLQHWGGAGHEDGVDILSTGPDGARWVTQCKRQRGLAASKVVPELRRVLESPPNPPPSVWRLVAPYAVPRYTVEKLEEEAAAATFLLRIALSWGETELVEKLRDYPQVLARFVELVGAPSFWNVPNPNEFFTGREDLLEELAACLGQEGQAALTQTITGLGGVGKSQIAIEYCHRHRGLYPGGVYWLDASSAESLGGDYARLAVEQGLLPREAPGDAATNAFLRDLATRESWLAVLDNADEPDAVRELLPPAASGQVLITSRNPSPGLGAGEPLVVDVLPLKQAADLLLARGRRGERHRPQAEALAEDLGRLPLALEQAGAYLAQQRRVSVAAYRRSFEKLRLEVLERQGPQQGQYKASVATTWSLSFKKLKQASPAAAEALEACAFLSPDAIPLALLMNTAPLLGPALAALVEKGKEDELALSEQLVEPLTRYSLVTWSEEEGEQLSMHRLVQEVMGDRLRAEGRFSKVFEQVHQALDASFPATSKESKSWPLCALLIPHIRSVLPLWRRHGPSLDWDPVPLWKRAGWYGFTAGRPAETVLLERELLSLRRRILGEEHPDTLVSMNNLAATLWSQGDLSGARVMEEEALAVRRRVLGAKHPDTLQSMNNLAATLRSQGDLSGAQALHEEALAIRRRVLGAKHPDTLQSMNNLALALWSQGDLSGAHALHEETLKVYRRVLGAEHPDTLQSMSNFALTLRSQGDLSGARALEEEALAVRRRVLGAEHPDTLTSLHNLCFTLRDLGDGGPDPVLVEELLEGVRKLPPGVEIREAALRTWSPEGSGEEEEGGGGEA